MLIEEDLTYKIRGCVFEVFRELGAGFLEKVYENSLVVELEKKGLNCKAQHVLTVNYKGNIVGEYIADLLVEDKVIIELRSPLLIRYSFWQRQNPRIEAWLRGMNACGMVQRAL